mmetsp:Transcript_55196/g.159845  ORF Transcript_55196/g.159845 Transcript_55196/m.159845 type:complete len:80 (-) Transcript_55196:56-295(-)
MVGHICIDCLPRGVVPSSIEMVDRPEARPRELMSPIPRGEIAPSVNDDGESTATCDGKRCDLLGVAMRGSGRGAPPAER